MITRNQYTNYEQLPLASAAFSELLSIVDNSSGIVFQKTNSNHYHYNCGCCCCSLSLIWFAFNTDSGVALKSVLVKVTTKYIFFLNEAANHKKTETPSLALTASGSALKDELKKVLCLLEEYEEVSGLKSGADLQEAIKF